MKVKRFIASDMKSAMAQVRQSLGAEAVILSNRMVHDGVEILASNDYDANAGTATSPVLNRPYRTYADIPDETPMRQSLLDEQVNIGSRASEAEFEQPDWARAAIFDRREQPEPSSAFDRVNQTASEKQAQPAWSNEFADHNKSPQTKQSVRQPDYSSFEIEDEVAEPASPAKSASTEAERARLEFSRQETDQLKQELQALRSMMETQMSMMQWDKQKRQSPVKTGLLKRLSELGLTVDISKQVLDKVKNINDAQLASKEAISALIEAIPTASDDILKHNGIVALVGPTGVGKTTTIAKLAARFVMANRASQMALVTLDNYRIGAQEQLFNYARILGVSVHNAKDSNELHKVLQNLYDKKLVLIDTAGMSHKDMRICEQFNTLKQGADEVRSYVVLAANAQTSALDETINAFKQTDISGCILTKLDESASLGGAISMLVRHKLPLTYISDGQAVPEDLRVGYGRELVAEALELMKKHAEPVHETDLASAFGQGLNHAH